MNNRRMDWFEMFMAGIVVVFMLLMTVLLYTELTFVRYATEQIIELEEDVAEIMDEIQADDIPEAVAPAAVEETEPVIYFDVPLDEDLQDHIFAECKKHDIDPAIVIAMIERESRYKAHVVGDSGRSFGLMQIQERWHSGRMEKLGCTDLLDPYQNVTVGIDFLAELIGRGNGLEWALMAYNGGPSYANRLWMIGTVSDYAKNVISVASEVEVMV